MKASFMFHVNPVHVKPGARSQAFHQLAGMLLQVPDVVDLQFGFVEGQPVEARLRIEVQLRHLLAHLLLADDEIFQNVFF